MTSPSAAPTLIAPSPASVAADGRARTYEVRTFGCQMNVHLSLIHISEPTRPY